MVLNLNINRQRKTQNKHGDIFFETPCSFIYISMQQLKMEVKMYYTAILCDLIRGKAVLVIVSRHTICFLGLLVCHGQWQEISFNQHTQDILALLRKCQSLTSPLIKINYRVIIQNFSSICLEMTEHRLECLEILQRIEYCSAARSSF